MKTRISRHPGASASPEIALASEKLESVRVNLEHRFLKAGTTIAAALDMIAALIRSLDQLGQVLEGDSGFDATGALRGTAQELIGLPQIQAARGAALTALAGDSRLLAERIESMTRTLRYLRAFSMNLKIAAASADTFNGFADEMQGRIAVGAQKLALLTEQLARLQDQLGLAVTLDSQLATDCHQVLPSVAANLQACADSIDAHNQEINTMVGQVAELARQVQAKVNTALLALQIGDNTRQRIEHVQTALALLQRQGGSTAGIDDAAQGGMVEVVGYLLLAQLRDLSESFSSDAQTVTDNLLGLGDDTRKVLGLKSIEGEGRTAHFLRHLEESVTDAQGIVDRVRTVNDSAEQISHSAVTAVETLLVDVGAVDAIRTEIQYMALNTTLRCSRMGDAGRPLDVIASELRTSAADLGSVADQTIRDLGGLADAAGHLARNSEGHSDLGGALSTAASGIRIAAGDAETQLEAISRQSADVARAMTSLSTNADFHADLQAELFEVDEILEGLAGEPRAESEDTPAALHELLAQIFKSYTMSREREIHQFAAPSGAAAQAVAAEPAMEDDDGLFASALF